MFCRVKRKLPWCHYTYWLVLLPVHAGVYARSCFGSCIHRVFKWWPKSRRRQQMVLWKPMFSKTWSSQYTTIIQLVEFFQNEWRVVSHTKIMGTKEDYCRNMLKNGMAPYILGTIWTIKPWTQWPGSKIGLNVSRTGVNVVLSVYPCPPGDIHMCLGRVKLMVDLCLYHWIVLACFFWNDVGLMGLNQTFLRHKNKDCLCLKPLFLSCFHPAISRVFHQSYFEYFVQVECMAYMKPPRKNQLVDSFKTYHHYRPLNLFFFVFGNALQNDLNLRANYGFV